ncbi:MAG: sigma-70 family RNA polymerase sigma factor [Candidatus Omnitrophica bacterium]|nr:sigma-70 family RNA polymerase sigma factor [Candidatus Omnitrophota bacterium]
MSSEQLSDEILVQKAREGDTKAFEELFDRYKKQLLNFIYRLIGNRETAEEVTQEVFIKVYNKLEIFDPSKKFVSWIYTIARNLAKNALRDKKYFSARSLEETVVPGDETMHLKDVIADSSAGPDQIIEDDELAEDAQRVLDSMPIKYREVIALCSVQGLTYKEAAVVLGCSIASISVRLEEAKLLFMKKLGIDMPGRKESDSL